jgi:membrane associated rhomboid family serine protease
MLRITDVVKHLIIINVLMYVAFVMVFPSQIRDAYTVLYMPWLEDSLGNSYFKPIQLVTHMFMHSDLGFRHIFFNMIMLFFLGPSVEQAIGKQKFLTYYLSCGFCAIALHILLAYTGYISSGSVVGASGAIMGVAIGFGLLFPNMRLMLIFPPIPIKAKYLIGAYVVMDLIGAFGGGESTTAHFAHLGGAIGGFLLMNMWGYFDWRRFK